MRIPFRGLFIALAIPSVAAGETDYATRIQPILSEYCYNCHGPDAGSREAELRLDTQEGAYRAKDGITAITPGDSKQSEVIRRIMSDDPDLVMPPPKSKRTLPAADKDALKQWVNEGAKWGRHWAFVAPARPPVPAKTANPIDAFVQDRLRKEGLTPSKEAPREDLLRRVSLDLTGLPPAPAELDAYVKDPAPDAYEKAVDRLLASPRFGERMVWEWLDAARYADTNGFQGDPTRAMWYWRDWAIRAFNDNLPFDRFTIEQLAGDLLPEPTRDQLIATGFHRNHMINGEGGRDAEESRVEYVTDRTETTSTVWMGLTLQCSKCHDHKFDPLSQADYYQLSAFFNSIEESGGNDANGLAHPVMTLTTPGDDKRLAVLKSAKAAAESEHDALAKRADEEQAAWEGSRQALREDSHWQALVPTKAASEGGATLTIGADGSVLASGNAPNTDEYQLEATVPRGKVTALRIEALPDPSLPDGGPGRAPNGNFVLGEIQVRSGTQPLGLTPLAADFEQAGWSFAQVVDGNDGTGWAIQPASGKAHEAILTLDTPLTEGQPLSIRLRFASPHKQHTLGRFRLSVADGPASQHQILPADVRTALAIVPASRTAKQAEGIRDFHRRTFPGFTASEKRRNAARAELAAAEKALPQTMVMRERAKPRDTFVLVKGNYQNHAAKVDRGVPAILPPLPAGATRNRLALANWLMSPEHPLTARVTVNRYWQMLFGTGLVKTVDDFGIQGERPSHPELLDWLAVEFRESGWNVKKMIRLIVTSATYRQSSVIAAGMAERDPDNRLLGRGPRHRLPSWMLRDQALAVSGLLVEKLGGPPVRGYQPAGVWEDATFGQIKYVQDHGEALYRRSLYTFWRRIAAPTMFFDVATRTSCSVRTGITNTPLHALVTLNDITYTEAARALAQRMWKEGGTTDGERIRFGFRLCTSRAPTAKDATILQSALDQLRTEYRADPASARQLISVGESHPDPAIDPVELAAYSGLASLLLNLDETLSNE